MKNVTITVALFCFISLQLDAQTKYTRIGVMGIEKVDLSNDHGVQSELKWIVPPVFLETERRLLKYFTLGSEIQFMRYGVDTDAGYSFGKFRSTGIGLEVQAKVSIPIANVFEVYGQYGLGYNHFFISSKTTTGDHTLEHNMDLGYITQSLSVGGSVIFAESFGFFLEAGVMKARTVKTMSELYEDSVAGLGYPNAPGGYGSNDYVYSSSPYVKVGIVFQIED